MSKGNAISDPLVYRIGVPKTAPLPHSVVQLGSLEMSSLIDSGSARTLISERTFHLIRNSKCLKKIEKCNISCFTASHEPLEISRSVILHFKIQGFSWNFKFLVAPNLHADMILGADFLRHSGLILDLHGNTFCFKFKCKNHFPISGYKPPICIEALSSFDVDCSNIENQCNTKTPELDETNGPDLSHLNSWEKRKVRRILEKYSSVLTTDLGRCNLLDYDIVLKDRKLVHSTPYTLSPPKMEFLRQHIDKLLSLNVIRPSKSSYASPAFLVPKGEKDFRMVIDYRKLNQQVDIEAVPLPDINTAFNWFAKAKYFCVLDLNSAYHQISLSERSKAMTAFCVPFGLFEWERIPFGLATGAQVLTRLGNLLFSDLRFKNLVNFIDDYVLFAETFDELMDVLDTVLSRFQKAGITINPKKLQVAVQQISYLGHLFSLRGLEVDPERTRAIRDFKPPRDAKGIARFLGMIQFYGKFISNLAERALPLNRLRKKGAKFEWGDEQQRAFEDLKLAIISPPVLQTPDFSKEFILQTDGSGSALGAVLLQEVDGVRLPVAFASRTLTDQEQKYSAYEIECLAVLFACDKFRIYLEHKEFLLECDNQALTWLLAHPRQLGRIGRWIIRISALKFRVQHIRGTTNVCADALSRMFHQEDFEPPEINVVKISVPVFPFAHDNLLQYQLEDPFLKEKITAANEGKDISPYLLKKGVVFCIDGRTNIPKIVVPQALIPMIFQYYHCSVFGAHVGSFRTLQRIRTHFTYAGMASDVKRRVKACEICCLSKPAQNTRVGFLSSKVPSRPMEKMHIDFVGPLPRSKLGNQFLLTCSDYFSKFVWLFPIRQATSVIAIKELKGIFQSFGFPESLVSDQGRQFTSDIFENFCFCLGIKHIVTPAYYPQANSAERVNRNLKSALIAYHHNSHNTWDENIPWLQLSFNLAYHEGHKHTPFEIMFSFPASHPLALHWSLNDLLPSEPRDIEKVWKDATKHLLNAHKKSEVRYNQSRQDHSFAVDDLVLLKAHNQSSKAKKFMAKLAFRWNGPYRIQSFLSPVTLLLADPKTGETLKKAHVSQLKKFCETK